MCQTTIKGLFALLFFLSGPSLAQGISPRTSDQAFETLSSQDRSRWSKEDNFEARKYEYFAIGQQISIQRLNIRALETSSGSFTLNRGQGKAPLRVSDSTVTESQHFWHVKEWTGEIVDQKSGQTAPFRVTLSAMAIDENGNKVFPDPNRPLVDRAMESDSAAVPKSSWDRRNEQIVWIARGRISVPWENTSLKITPIDSKPGSHIFYDMDPDRNAPAAIDGPRGESPLALSRGQASRAEYDEFINNLKSELKISE